MPATFKWPKPKEAFFLFAAICLLIAPEFIIKTAIFDTMALLQLILLMLLAACLVFPLWSFYRAFLKGPLRARRIDQIRNDRLMRELMEERRLESFPKIRED